MLVFVLVNVAVGGMGVFVAVAVLVRVPVGVLVLVDVPVAVTVLDGVTVGVFVGDGGVPVQVCVIVGDTE